MIARQRRKWLWTFVFVGVVLCFSVQSSPDINDEKEEIKAILGSDPVQAASPEGGIQPPVISSEDKNATKKLKIVVSSINEGGVKEDGQIATEANVSAEAQPASVEEKAVAKNNQVVFF
jgi:hypothetical protein